jgi:hypothetical protein
VNVDARDDNARLFCERENFLSFPNQPMTLFVGDQADPLSA